MSDAIHEHLPKAKEPAPMPTPPRRGRVTLDPDTLGESHHSGDVAHARAALGYIERSARRGLGDLSALTHDQSPRDAIVTGITLEIDHAAEDLATKAASLSKAELVSLRDSADKAADAVLRLRAWIRARAPNARMVAHIESTILQLDPVLLRFGVLPVGQRATPALIDDETAEAKAETTAVALAAANLLAAIERERSETVTGIRAFCNVAMIEDEEDPPSFIEAVAKSLIIAALGHVVGEQMGKFLGSIAKRTRQAVPEKSMERFVDITTDFVQGFSGELVAARNASQEVATKKARAYFAMALETNAHRLAFEQTRGLNALVAAGAADPATLVEAYQTKVHNASSRAASYAQIAAQLWAEYQAQSRLGTHAHGVNGRKISNMTDYFGQRNETGRDFGTGRQGTDGVGRLSFTVAPRSGELAAGVFTVSGSNSVIAEHVAANAGGQLDKIWLPKEVTVFLAQYRAVIAIDETNRVRDSIGWDDIARAFPDHRVLGTPFRFWSHVRGTRL